MGIMTMVLINYANHVTHCVINVQQEESINAVPAKPEFFEKKSVILASVSMVTVKTILPIKPVLS